MGIELSLKARVVPEGWSGIYVAMDSQDSQLRSTDTLACLVTTCNSCNSNTTECNADMSFSGIKMLCWPMNIFPTTFTLLPR